LARVLRRCGADGLGRTGLRRCRLFRRRGRRLRRRRRRGILRGGRLRFRRGILRLALLRGGRGGRAALVLVALLAVLVALVVPAVLEGAAQQMGHEPGRAHLVLIIGTFVVLRGVGAGIVLRCRRRGGCVVVPEVLGECRGGREDRKSVV